MLPIRNEMRTSCPSDARDTADAYIMGHLTPREHAAFDRHLDYCIDCGNEVEIARTIRQMIREVASLLEPKQPLG
jgi:hypothetical protein